MIGTSMAGFCSKVNSVSGDQLKKWTIYESVGNDILGHIPLKIFPISILNKHWGCLLLLIAGKSSYHLR